MLIISKGFILIISWLFLTNSITTNSGELFYSTYFIYTLGFSYEFMEIMHSKRIRKRYLLIIMSPILIYGTLNFLILLKCIKTLDNALYLYIGDINKFKMVDVNTFIYLSLFYPLSSIVISFTQIKGGQNAIGNR